jgi:hypothetical protein
LKFTAVCAFNRATLMLPKCALSILTIAVMWPALSVTAITTDH